MKIILCIAVVLLLVCSSAPAALKHGGHGGPPPPPVLTDEEFVGPFASWMCARTSSSGTCSVAAAQFCNAAGNGVADDTTAIQNCINSLGSTKSVIYFPCGTYNISTTLTIAAQQYVALIGQDNSTASGRCTTALKWTGSSGGKLIYINGVFASQLSRLTFNGNNLANILVDQSWDGSTGFFDATNQYIDDVFENGNDNTTSYGLRCGALSQGCSETNVLRNIFSNLGFGVAICNANALDMWVWYSSFSNMKIGVTDDTNTILGGSGCSAGGYHVMGSVFSGSSLDDMYINNSDINNILDNYSSGSAQFASVHGNTTFQRNTIINTNLSNSSIISIGGFMLLFDNIMENTNSVSPYVTVATAVALNNKFTNSSPYTVNNHLYNQGDQTISYAPPSAPTLPGVLPNHNRTIYEGSALGIQAAICKASNGVGSVFTSGACTGSPDGLKNVAHIATGSYSISSSLVVPADSNVQIIGDGWNTILTSITVNPVIVVNGPSYATMRGFQVLGANGNTANDGIHISGDDQSSAYLYSRGGRYGNSTNALVMNGLANIVVSADGMQTPGDSGSSPIDIVQTGSNHFNHFLGTGAAFSVSGGSNVVFVGGWAEASGFLIQSAISGTGLFVHSTAHLGAGGTNNFFTLNNFTGTFALLDSPVTVTNTVADCPYTGLAIDATGSGVGGLIVDAVDTYPTSTAPISNTAGSTAFSFGNLASQCVPNSGIPDTPSTITTGNLATISSAISYFRTTKPLLPNGTSSGITGIELYDLFVSGFATAVKVSP